MQRTVIFAILVAFCLAGCARPAPERPLPTSVGAAPLADAPLLAAPSPPSHPSRPAAGRHGASFAVNRDARA